MISSTIARLRLTNQRLQGKKFETTAQVVTWMGAVQGQEYPFAKWALGMRMRGATAAAVEQAFDTGEILRTHVMRPTWHFVTPLDIRWLLDLTAPRVDAAMAYGYRQAGLARTLARRSNTVIERALSGSNALTRQELRKRLEKEGIAVETAARMGVIMMWAELDGIVCSGPRRGNQFTYILLDERAPNAKSLPREDALAELTRRYFSSHGPATVNDFAWWSGLTVADVSAGLAMLGSEMRQQEIDGKTYCFSSKQPAPHKTVPTAHFLPVLDEYVVAYRDPELIYDPSLAKQARNRNFVSSVELDGRIVGEWKPQIDKDTVVIELQLYTDLTLPEQRALDTAATEYGTYLGRDVKIEPIPEKEKGK